MKNPVSDDPKKAAIVGGGVARVVHGGNSTGTPIYVKGVRLYGARLLTVEVAFRDGKYKAGYRDMDIGFRVVRNKPKSKK